MFSRVTTFLLEFVPAKIYSPVCIAIYKDEYSSLSMEVNVCSCMIWMEGLSNE